MIKIMKDIQRLIKIIVLFGSAAVGKKKESSDLDIAVYLRGEKKLLEDPDLYLSVLRFVCDLTKFPEEKIDLTDLKNADILLRYEIMKNGKLLYGDKDFFDNYKLFAIRDYYDAFSLFNLEDYLIKNRQKLLRTNLKR